VGEVQGQHFFSMQYVEGPSLAKKLSEGPLNTRVAARYLLDLARAVAHAHRRQILHRDIKPSNVLIDGDDQPHITDFGLAKRLGDSSQTRTGSILGTPSYMSPEQAEGRGKDLGPATDVYGLGSVLYEMLTGRPPFCSDTPLDTLMDVIHQDPAPPRLLNSKVDPDLETICLKCLEKDPRHRYPTADALADELDRFLKGESIQAQSFNLLGRLSRALEHSHYDVEFGSWGTMLLFFAAIVGIEHLILYLLIEMRQPTIWLVLTRCAQFLLMGVVFWQYRSKRLLPATSAERQLWGIWLGYLAGGGSLFLIDRQLVNLDGAPELSMYPAWSVLTGLAFFVMGSNYWGHCYAVGAAFFGLAMLMPFKLAWAPLLFGLAWTVTLLVIGLRLRGLGKEGDSSPRPESAPTIPLAPPRISGKIDHKETA